VTCIAGVVEGDRIFIGGDSAGVAGYALTVRADQKVFRNGDFLFGFCGSFRMGQLLRYAFTPPKHTRRTDLHRYMVTSFIDAVREVLKKGGVAEKEKEVEAIDGSFMVGYRGRLFTIEADYQVGEAVDGFAAIGCGAEIAQGALFVTEGAGVDGKKRVRQALEAAERYSAGVRRPFYVQMLEGKGKPEKAREDKTV
jgi:ATP-dependent protease HslVU (ClpYQ) peptidase subunit